MASLEKWFIRSGRRRGDVKVAASLIDPNLDRLCDVCSLIKFKRHEFGQCEETQCNFRQFQPANIFVSGQGSHSTAYYHHTSYRALEESSYGGCHLCTIFRAGLEQVWDSLDNPELAVLVFWSKTEAGRTLGADRPEWESYKLFANPDPPCSK
jgi:hypothetical protein